MADDGFQPGQQCCRGSALFWITVMVAGALAFSVLLGTLRWLGAPTSGTQTRGDSGGQIQLYLKNRLSGTLEGLTRSRRIYWISRDALAAPAPDPACYGQAEQAGELEFLSRKAKNLLDGQELFFDAEVTPLPGTPIRYYLDDTILAITWKQPIDGGVYTFSEVKIAHPSQFRRFLAGGEFGSDKLFVTTEMAKSVNAVVASSGDFYNYRQAGTLVHDGQVRRVHNGLVDTCYVDENGDLLFSDRDEDRSRQASQDFVDERNILFSLAFGPVLIREGEVVTPETYAVGEINDHYPRSALCQLGKLHYLLAVVNGEGNYGQTPTLHRFGENLQQRGVKTAYTLDGGQTAVIAMDGELINSVLFGYQRKISDIIYFATAIPCKT